MDRKKDWLKSFREALNSNPIIAVPLGLFFVFGSIIRLVTFYTCKYDVETWEGIIVESHGLLGDILLFGILIKLIELATQKKNDQKRWLEEIDDFRRCETEEIMYRNVGNIKRLMKSVSKELFYFDEIYLKGAHLFKANFKHASLLAANFEDALLPETNFMAARLYKANFKGAYLYKTNFKGAVLSLTNFSNADLFETNLGNSFLYEANLTEANLTGADLTKADLTKADLTGVKCLAILQLSTVKTLYKAKLDPELMKKIEDEYPHLLRKPGREGITKTT